MLFTHLRLTLMEHDASKIFIFLLKNMIKRYNNNNFDQTLLCMLS